MGLTEEVTFEQRSEGSKRRSHVDTWRRRFQQKEGACLVCLRNSKEAMAAGAQWGVRGAEMGQKVPGSQISKGFEGHGRVSVLALSE